MTGSQKEFLDDYAGSWKINPKTGLVDINVDFQCCYFPHFFGIKFGKASGYFRCNDSRLISLNGAPLEVGEDFDCSNNQLVSLEGGTLKVGNVFYCDSISLRDCPINLLDDKIIFHKDGGYFDLKDFVAEIPNGIEPMKYLEKMI